jgi:hypothetical protein
MHIDTDTFVVPKRVSVQATLTVPKQISALELIPTENGTRLGPVVSIPKGARLETCGLGFSERTIKARCQGRFYFVFLRDLELLENPGSAIAGLAHIQALGNQRDAARL